MPKKLIHSFNYARLGAEHILRTQRNIRIHIFAGIIVLSTAFWLKVTMAEAALLTLTIAFVVAAEMFNTAIEEIVNLVKPEESPLAGMIKNISAAAVLTTALGAIVIGMLIFVPKLIELWK